MVSRQEHISPSRQVQARRAPARTRAPVAKRAPRGATARPAALFRLAFFAAEPMDELDDAA